MKKCAYCGRETEEETAFCRECGTKFIAPSAEAEIGPSRELTWLEWLMGVLRYAGLLLVVIFLYLLSFGPVNRHCRTALPATPVPRTVQVNGQQTVIQTMVVRVSYPRWVGLVYAPAFIVLSADGGNGLYGRYLHWWEQRPDSK